MSVRYRDNHPANFFAAKIIGSKWKAETEAVRNEYKRKAEDAKRQHTIVHPKAIIKS